MSNENVNNRRIFEPAYAECNTDDADYSTVLLALGACAESWEPNVRLIGNVRAGDIVRALSIVLHKEKADDQ